MVSVIKEHTWMEVFSKADTSKIKTWILCFGVVLTNGLRYNVKYKWDINVK